MIAFTFKDGYPKVSRFRRFGRMLDGGSMLDLSGAIVPICDWCYRPQAQDSAHFCAFHLKAIKTPGALDR